MPSIVVNKIHFKGSSLADIYIEMCRNTSNLNIYGITIVRCDVWSTPSFQNIPENPIKPSFKEAVNDRKMVEMSSSSWNIVRQISERVVENGGAALVADYGHTGQDGDTFRAFRHHKQVK